MCGEKYINGKKWEEIAGSPPRVRGKEGNLKMKTTEQRITPACAGKSLPALLPYLNRLGSPPRVRGKVHASTTLLFMLRITPACAGKRLTFSGTNIANHDHPRVCGEKARCTAGIFPVSGSPPRVRGKADVRRRGAYTSRITPACAGKRHSDCTGNSAHRDHPRVCGEKAPLPGR